MYLMFTQHVHACAHTYKPFKELIFFHLTSVVPSETEHIISENVTFAFKPNVLVLQIHFLPLLKRHM